MSSFELVSAFLLDLAIGDPPRLPHPVRWIGRAILVSEGRLRYWAGTPNAEKVAGVILVGGVTGAVYVSTAGVIWLLGWVHPILGSLATIYVAYTTLSIKSLRDAAADVLHPLSDDQLERARESLSSLVGRQTAELKRTGIVQATVESIAENTSDGIVAPLFFMALGGAPLTMAYKAINTLDSMVGYKTPRYKNLGWASARADDIANFIPSRITGVLISVAGGLLSGGRVGRAIRVMVRDGHKHESPNSGFPEAAMAGALGIQLGGPVSHPEKPGVRAFLGDGLEEPGSEHIKKAIFVMYGASTLMVCAVLWVG